MATQTSRVQLRVVNPVSDVLARVAAYERYLIRQRWIYQAQAFAVAIGARPLVSHVAPATWAQYEAANEDAYTAVLLALAGVD